MSDLKLHDRITGRLHDRRIALRNAELLRRGRGRFVIEVRDVWDRLVASDPGLAQLRLAVRILALIMTALALEFVYARIVGIPAISSMLLAATICMVLGSSIRETIRLASFRAAWPGVPASLFGLALASLISHLHVLTLIVFVVVSFFAVWVRRFGGSWTAYGLAAWQMYFFALFLRPPLAQLPGLLGAVLLACAWVMLLVCTVLHEDPATRLRRTVTALRARSRAVISSCLDVIRDPTDETEVRQLRSQLVRVSEVALLFDGQLSEKAALPQGVRPGRLRRWVVDVEVGIDELASATVAFADVMDEVEPRIVGRVRRTLHALGWGHLSNAVRAAHALREQDSPAVRRIGTVALFLVETINEWTSGKWLRHDLHAVLDRSPGNRKELAAAALDVVGEAPVEPPSEPPSGAADEPGRRGSAPADERAVRRRERRERLRRHGRDLDDLEDGDDPDDPDFDDDPDDFVEELVRLSRRDRAASGADRRPYQGPAAGMRALARLDHLPVDRTTAGVPGTRQDRREPVREPVPDPVREPRGQTLSPAAGPGSHRFAVPTEDPAEETGEFESVVELRAGNLPGTAPLAEQVVTSDSAPWWSPKSWPLTTRQAVQAAIAAALAIGVGQAISPQRYYWAVVSAFLMFTGAATASETVRRSVNRVIGTGLGLLVSVFLANLTNGSTVAQFAVLLLALALGWYLLSYTYGGMMFGITVALGQMYGLMHSFSDEVLLMRLTETLAGAVIGGAVGLLVLPASARRTLRVARSELMESLSALLDDCAEMLHPGPEGPVRHRPAEDDDAHEVHDDAQKDAREDAADAAEDSSDGAEEDEDEPLQSADVLADAVAVDERARLVMQTTQSLIRGRFFGSDRSGLRHRVAVLSSSSSIARRIAMLVERSCTDGDAVDVPGAAALGRALRSLADEARRLGEVTDLRTAPAVVGPGIEVRVADQLETVPPGALRSQVIRLADTLAVLTPRGR